MKKTELEKIFEETFGFLLTDYNFCKTLSKQEEWGYHFIATNSTTGIEIEYEFREAYIQIYVYKLVDGKIVKNVSNAIKNNKPIMGFGLGWIIESVNPADRIKPAYEYGKESSFYDNENGLKNYADFVASKLKRYANDILRGDFSLFGDLDALVKENNNNQN